MQNEADTISTPARRREDFISVSHWGMFDINEPPCTLNAEIEEWLETDDE